MVRLLLARQVARQAALCARRLLQLGRALLVLRALLQ